MIANLMLALSMVVGAPPPSSEPAAQEHGSKTPPEGAPWTTDFLAARATALREQKPLFLFSTKTY